MATLDATKRIDTIRAAKKLAKALRAQKANRKQTREVQAFVRQVGNLRTQRGAFDVLEVC